jgi:hypothetical protein
MQRACLSSSLTLQLMLWSKLSTIIPPLPDERMDSMAKLGAVAPAMNKAAAKRVLSFMFFFLFPVKVAALLYSGPVSERLDPTRQSVD